MCAMVFVSPLAIGKFRNLRASLFNDDLLNEPNFGRIQLVGQYLYGGFIFFLSNPRLCIVCNSFHRACIDCRVYFFKNIVYKYMYDCTEAEFLDVIGPKVLEKFSSFLFTVTSANRFYPPPPPPSKSGLKLVCTINIVGECKCYWPDSESRHWNQESGQRRNKSFKNIFQIIYFQSGK